MVFFVAGLHYMRPHLMTKKAENMRLRTRVWAQAPKPSSFAELDGFLPVSRPECYSARRHPTLQTMNHRKDEDPSQKKKIKKSSCMLPD